MVKYQPRSIDAVFGALADPARRRIVERLAHGEASVSELAEPFGMSLPAVTKHLRVLEHAGLLRHRKIGRTRLCRLAPRQLQRADKWLAPYRIFWETRLDALAAHLERREL